MEKFRELGIAEDILKALEEIGFKEPTEIQEKTIKVALENRDIIGGSATGSGKTLAFSANIIQSIEKGNGIKALILSPTRELAEQISDSMKAFSKYRKLSITSIYGGVSYNPQFAALKKADIVVGTPGRILDHLERGTLNLSKVKHLVLDEADRMLDMGFLDDVQRIMSACPKEKQTMLFSATISEDIQSLTKKFMKDPHKVSLESYVDPKLLNQVYYDIQSNMKFSLLVHLIKNESTGLVMIFCNSRKTTDIVEKGLKKNGIEAIAIHGGLSQAKRNHSLSQFHNSKVTALICTDVAARGLDIPNVSHVYNYDMPNDSKQYVHRIGRTARAGASGKVINLISDRDQEAFGQVLRYNDIKVKKQERPYIENVPLDTSIARRGRDQGRQSGGGGFGARRGPGRSERRSNSETSSGYGSGRGRRTNDSGSSSRRTNDSSSRRTNDSGSSSRRTNDSRGGSRGYGRDSGNEGYSSGEGFGAKKGPGRSERRSSQESSSGQSRGRGFSKGPKKDGPRTYKPSGSTRRN